MAPPSLSVLLQGAQEKIEEETGAGGGGRGRRVRVQSDRSGGLFSIPAVTHLHSTRRTLTLQKRHLFLSLPSVNQEQGPYHRPPRRKGGTELRSCEKVEVDVLGSRP